MINIGSTNADRMPFAGGAVHAMSKSALKGLVQGLARDLGLRGITVNNVQRGPIDTDMNPANGAFAESLTKLMALPRYGSAEEVAGKVAYLAGGRVRHRHKPEDRRRVQRVTPRHASSLRRSC